MVLTIAACSGIAIGIAAIIFTIVLFYWLIYDIIFDWRMWRSNGSD